MKLEEQVASLELCKRLKELGVRQENALFYWSENYATGGKTWFTLEYFGRGIPSNANRVDTYSAFTCSELGEMLPESFVCGKPRLLYKIRVSKEKNYWWCGYRNPETGGTMDEYADTEADARAKCLIYLIESRIIKPSAVKFKQTSKCSHQNNLKNDQFLDCPKCNPEVKSEGD